MEPEPFSTVWYFVSALVFLMVLGLGLYWLVVIKRQIRQTEEESGGDTLAEYEQLYLEGELSSEEIEHIRKRFGASSSDATDTGAKKLPQPPQADRETDDGEFTSDPPTG